MPPTNDLDCKHYQNMSSMFDSAHREQQLAQYFHHSKPKNVYSFIKGRQSTLGEHTTLIANLIIDCTHCTKPQINLNYQRLITWFLKDNPKVVKQSKFKSWHEKNQGMCPWLTHTCITRLHSFLALLEDVSCYYKNHEILTAVNNLP